MSSFREQDGLMETGHGLTGRKVLLPFEAELCDQLGITKDEYFEYLSRAALTEVDREGFEHVPDVRAEITTTTLAIIQLVVGLTLTAVALLSQKPRQKRPEPVNVQKEDNIGRQRFTPTTDFGSVQEVAKLGTTVPLIFCKRREADGTFYGGCRGNALLTHSALSSLHDSQRIKAIAVTCLSGLREAPSFDGLAVGDQLLQDFNNYKLQAYYKPDDNPIREGDRYDEGELKVKLDGEIAKTFWHTKNQYERVFAGTRTPGSKTQFGLYAPMPNNNGWNLDFQMFVLPDAAPSAESSRVRRMRDKIGKTFPLFASVDRVIGDKVIYKILGLDDNKVYERFFDEGDGVTPEDIRNQVNQQRYFFDNNINEGELYLMGNRLAVCVKRPTEDFLPGGSDFTYEFRLLDDGEWNPKERPYSKSNLEVDLPHWDGPADQVQRFSDAAIANNQTCDCTEIGIGSTVWKRISGSNVNNFPGDDAITEMENNDAGGTYDIGRMDVFVRRYSCFQLQVKLDGKGDWVGARHIFAVEGNRPVEQFNAIRIYHPRGQHEFRLRPFPSKLAYNQNRNQSKPVYLLKARKGLDTDDAKVTSFFHSNGFTCYFEGRQLTFSKANARNVEGFKGSRDDTVDEVVGFDQSSWSPDTTFEWTTVPEEDNPRYKGVPGVTGVDDTRIICRERTETNTQEWKYFWEGQLVAEQETRLSRPLTGKDRIAYVNSRLRYEPAGRMDTRHTEGVKRYFFSIKRSEYLQIDRRPDGEATREPLRPLSGNGKDLDVFVQKFTDGSYEWTRANQGRNFRDGDRVELKLPRSGGETVRFKVLVETIAESKKDNPGWWEIGDMYPLHAVTDYRNHDTESCSNTDGPEHRVTYVNEFIDAPDTKARGTYKDLSSISLIINSSRDLNNLAQISAYYKEGLPGQKLGQTVPDARIAPLDCLPEVAYFLLTDRRTGAGAVIDTNQIDYDSFEKAADYCRKNRFYWDGVISERVNLREWIYEQATYCLLDFTMKGGRFGLVPAIPLSSDGLILTEWRAKPEIKGLFTDGNIRSMKVSTVAPEDRKLFECEVLWRRERENHFPETMTTNVRLANYGTQAVETYDLTQFCTSREQTIAFAKYALMVRKYVDHSISFETTPEAMAGIEPGDYVRVVSHICHPSRFVNGHVTSDGYVVSSGDFQSGSQVYYWRPGFNMDPRTNSYIRVGRMYVKDGKVADAYRGCVFSAVNTTSTDRVYKIDSVSIGEEGFVQVSGAHMPLTEGGALEIMQGWDNNEGFIVNDID